MLLSLLLLAYTHTVFNILRKFLYSSHVCRSCMRYNKIKAATFLFNNTFYQHMYQPNGNIVHQRTEGLNEAYAHTF